jgi:hypothetical protein
MTPRRREEGGLVHFIWRSTTAFGREAARCVATA